MEKDCSTCGRFEYAHGTYNCTLDDPEKCRQYFESKQSYWIPFKEKKGAQ